MPSNIRRSRGYAYESYVTKQIDKQQHWHAWRLGGTQIELPDILAVNNHHSKFRVIECKTTQNKSIYVKAHQIRRMRSWLYKFEIYLDRTCLLAFKFTTKSGHKRVEYMFDLHGLPVTDYRCDDDGFLYLRHLNSWQRVRHGKQGQWHL